MTTIIGLRVHRVPAPLVRPFVTAVRRTEAIDGVLVEAVDADGRSGWGEAATSWRVTGESPESVAAVVSAALSGAVVGRDAADPDLPDRIRGAVVGNAAARSAVECAVADLAAQQAGTELSVALGAEPGAVVRTDMTLSASNPPELVRLAEVHVADGFTTLKVKATTDTDTIAGLTAMRSSLGSDLGLRVDANQAWTVEQAVRIIRECEDLQLGIEFFEQPVAAAAVAGLAAVRAAVGTPILADESVRTVRDLELVAERDAADAVNVKLAKAGGIAEARRLVSAARDAGMGVIVGCMMEGPVGVAAAASLAAAVAPGTVHDLDAGLWLGTSPVIGGATYRGDRIEFANGPGLGVVGLATEAAA